MFPAWVPYQPVNFSQDVSVMHKWTRCQPSPTASLHPTGGAGKGWARPWLPSHPSARAVPSLFRRKKGHVRPREDAIRPSLASFCPHSCRHLVRVGMGRNGSRTKAVGGEEGQAGKEGVCCPQPGDRATSTFWSLRLLHPVWWREDMAQVVGNFLAHGEDVRGFWAAEEKLLWMRHCPLHIPRQPAAISLQRSWGKRFFFKPCRSSMKEVIATMIYCSSPTACFIAGCKKVSTSDYDFICPVP